MDQPGIGEVKKVAAEGVTEVRRKEALLKTGALQDAIFNSANFSSIATDEKGVIQLFNVGAERMLGYTAAEVLNKITPAEISDPQEVIARAAALSTELGTKITPGFEALVFKASREIEDIYELTYIRKDGSRFPAVVSVTALRDDHDAIIGYLLIGTDNTARKRVEEEQKKLDQRLRDQQFYTRPDIRLLTAVNGALGVEAARTSRPTVILMDINLPGMSGVDAFGLLGADPTTARIPVVALSANAMPRDIQATLDAGFFRYLTKPIKVKEFMDTLNAAFTDRFNARSGQTLAVRIGINSGAGVAGVIGKRKFIYDLWGDAVNIASRMESHGMAGRVQVTQATRHRLSEVFRLEERGMIDLKGTGPMHTWFLTGRSDLGRRG